MPNREMGIGGLIRGAPGPVIGIVGCVLSLLGSVWQDSAGLLCASMLLEDMLSAHVLLLGTGMTYSGAAS